MRKGEGGEKILFHSFLLAILAGCTKTVGETEDALWYHIKSPVTGKCYEVFSFISMNVSCGAEIPCEQAKLSTVPR